MQQKLANIVPKHMLRFCFGLCIVYHVVLRRATTSVSGPFRLSALLHAHDDLDQALGGPLGQSAPKPVDAYNRCLSRTQQNKWVLKFKQNP